MCGVEARLVMNHQQKNKMADEAKYESANKTADNDSKEKGLWNLLSLHF